MVPFQSHTESSAPGSRHPSTARPSSATLATSRGPPLPTARGPGVPPAALLSGRPGPPLPAPPPTAPPWPRRPVPGWETWKSPRLPGFGGMDGPGLGGSGAFAGRARAAGARAGPAHTCVQSARCTTAFTPSGCARPARPPEAAGQPGALVPAPSRPSLSSPWFPSRPRRARGARAPPVKVYRGKGPAAADAAAGSSCSFLLLLCCSQLSRRSAPAAEDN